ncbi:alpha-galactosidase [Planotetraspora sp. A-T 1434]|uniref:glycoside hydrolase family 36 protein n=1 Tax=Planotetraspora sp. A-T 1434 TaxID=2979219 RepID=UPI0021C09717|nr:glycoside hydrolase family 36 protein [Planotetraspora sp. A-T 1434]MCT9930344.1 alpha-galactosidase [Planotetraspora sp. A-T 1434]
MTGDSRSTSQAAPGIWQPHDEGDRGGTAEARVPTGLFAGGAELILDVTGVAELSWIVHRAADGVAEVRVESAVASVVRVAWRLPCVAATAFWTPDSGEHRGLPPFWRRPRTVSLEKGAPVGCLVGAGDVSLCAFALREVVGPVTMRTGVVEETGEFGFWAEHEAGPGDALVLRLDLGGRPFSHALADVAAWWAEQWDSRPGVPEVARMPVYSTWYAMQQHVTAEAVERQAAAAKRFGCDTIIVDDGWHSDDRGRGYGYVGEWHPSTTSFPDMSGHVARVRDGGTAYLLWYALPFVGRHTALWDQVQPYALAYKEHMDAVVVDPRHPAVRDLLCGHLARAVNEWHADGLKIDFIDQFVIPDPPPPGPEADCATVTEGVRRLLAELGERLGHRVSSGRVLVELRQPYVSPGLWPYATMIRASDCPLSPAQNRQRTVDLRLVAGPLAVHADMLMWHFSESPERVAAQLINVLFAVPQISADLTALTPGQEAALTFWLGFFRRNAAVLQGGVFEPARPDLGYPLVRARDDDTVIVGRYAPLPIEVPPARTLLVANADSSAEVLLDVREACVAGLRVVDCRGRTVSESVLSLTPGVHPVTVPTGGLLELVPRIS